MTNVKALQICATLKSLNRAEVGSRIINLTGHDLNVAVGTGGNAITIPTAKDSSGNTWSIRVSQENSSGHTTGSVMGVEIKLFGHTQTTHLSLFCKETKEELALSTDEEFPTELTGMLPVVSAMVGGLLPFSTALQPMTSPSENPTRNEKGWIIAVKGLKFNEGNTPQMHKA